MLIVLLLIGSVTYLIVTKEQAAHRAQTATNALAGEVHHNAALVRTLRHQQGIIDANEKRLEDLVLAISTAKTPGEAKTAIQKFLKSSASAHHREQQYQRRNGGGGQSSSSSQPPSDTQGSSSPQPQPEPSSSHSPKPRPSQTPRPSHSPSASPSPSPPVQVCIASPVGKICEPPGVRCPVCSVLYILERGVVNRCWFFCNFRLTDIWPIPKRA